MNTKELLKKYWFVCVVAIALLAFIGYYAADSYKNREITVSSRQIDGKYVAYTIDDEPVFADDLYDSLFKYQNTGASQAMVAYERDVFNAAYETTDEMKNKASISASNAVNSYSKEYLDNYLRSVGYRNGFDDITEYYIDSLKQEQLVKEYVFANLDTYFTPQLGTNGRLIYHILVKCDTVEVTDEEGNVIGYEAAPTEEQEQKIHQIQDLINEGTTPFEYIAYQYSEDSSRTSGGYIGIINEENSANYDSEFAKAAMALKEDEVSDIVVSQFGYHIIKNAGTTPEKILDDFYFLSSLENSDRLLTLNAVLEKGKELGFEIVSPELKEYYESLTESEGE